MQVKWKSTEAIARAVKSLITNLHHDGANTRDVGDARQKELSTISDQYWESCDAYQRLMVGDLSARGHASPVCCFVVQGLGPLHTRPNRPRQRLIDSFSTRATAADEIHTKSGCDGLNAIRRK